MGRIKASQGHLHAPVKQINDFSLNGCQQISFKSVSFKEFNNHSVKSILKYFF